MNLQIWSDLHDEHMSPAMVQLAGLQVDPAADLLVLAGDIASGDASFRFALDLAQKAQKPVVWLPGNHEFYGRDMVKQTARYRTAAAQHPEVIALLDGVQEFQGVRLVGSTLWTDFKLYEGAVRLPTAENAMDVGDRSLSDFQLISWSGDRFTAKKSATLHTQSREFIASVLNTPFDGPTVVITHHGPHPKSVHASYAAGERVLRSPTRLPDEKPSWAINPCFVSDLTPLVSQADLWIHGHVHNSFDYTVNGCRVVANPRGYPLRIDRQGTPMLDANGALVFENKEYDPRKLLIV